MNEVARKELSREREKEEIYSELRSGYDSLQEWWGDFLDILPDQEWLRELAVANHDPAKLRSIDVNEKRLVHFLAVKISLHSSDFWSLASPFFSNLLNYELFAEANESGYRFAIEAKEPEVKRIPPWYPFYRAKWTTGDDFRKVKSFEIRHQAQAKEARLIETQIQLSSNQQAISSITQVLKDETLFPNPSPRHTKSRPYQQFCFWLTEDGEPEYRFAYLNRSRNYSRWVIAKWAQKRNSFLPHLGFYLPEAIKNASLFKPAVTGRP